MKRPWTVFLMLFSGCIAAPMAVRPVLPASRGTVLVERERLAPARAPAPAPVDGIEALPGWVAADPQQWTDVNASEAKYLDHAGSGKLLLVRWKGEGKGKAIITRVGELSLPAAGRLRFRTYSYADHEIKLALGLFVGEERVYYETPEVRVPPRAWADHAYELGMRYFKCAASKWEHASALDRPEEVKELVILIYDRGSGSLYIDALLAAGQ